MRGRVRAVKSQTVLLDVLKWLWGLLNSNFGMSAVGAFAGAWGGAYAAQRIADRAKVRDQLLHEVRSSNAAIDLAHQICSTYLGLKEQHVRALKETYDAQRAAVRAHYQGQEDGTIPAGTQLYIGALDLRSLDKPPVRIDRLEDVVMEKLSVSGRPRPVLAILAQSIAALNETIDRWNKLIADFKARGEPRDDATMAYLFGLQRGHVIDTTFVDAVQALYKQTDDCIFFSKLLSSDMTRHGDQMRRDFKRRFRGEVPRVQRVLWEQVERKGLFPPEQEYATWISGYRRRPPRAYGRRLEKLSYALRKLFRLSTFRECLYWLCYMPSPGSRPDA
jgi:hypothetical protein